ncbi:secreted RxLR effector protein 78-like [Lotus japonicus]|uniref:secreted RxLR effector protein 78-like n=1 Tax=Lotus japonicus TaxID=34305 RepID=UPI0025841133|nr:secreted RxLR effector protein 78-like [Lotus japonicus]
MEEIKEAVWDCDGDRSPGPDGYNFRFIKSFWHLMHLDIKKIVSKIISKRLKHVLSKLIDVNQFAFLGERNMMDSVLIVNEIVDEAKRKKKPTIIFKVDYEKAYDSVRWDFLLYMLRRMNFCDKWIKWIRGCLESNSVSVLVNGSPGPEFRMCKGLRQGDPLAPFLFLVVAEGLNGLFKKAVQLDKFTCLRMTPFSLVKQ